MPIIPKGTKPGDVLVVPGGGMPKEEQERKRAQPDYYRRYEERYNPTYDPLSADTVDFNIEQTPGWEILTPMEQRVTKGFIEGMGSVSRRASDFFQSATRKITESEAYSAALDIPILNAVPYALSKGIQYLMAATDALAEGPERVGGMISQYAYAKENGQESEFLKDLGHAWQASSFYYNTLPAAFDPETDGVDKVPLSQYGYGPAQLVKVRKYLDQGLNFDQINGKLMADMGALYYRGTLLDIVAHTIVDLSWVTGAMGLKPMSLIQKARTGILGGTMALEAAEEAGRILKNGVAVTDAYRGAAAIAEAGARTVEGVAPGLDVASVALKAKVAADLGEGGILRRWAQDAKALFGESIAPNAITPAERSIAELEQDLLTFATKADLSPDEVMRGHRALQAVEDITSEMAVMQRTLLEKMPKTWDQLSGLQRTFIRATGGTGLALKTPDEALQWLNDGAKFYKPWTWFRLSPESKAMELSHMLRDDLMARLRGAKTIEEIQWRLGNPLRGLLDPRLGLQPFSIQGRTTMVALKHVGGKVDEMARVYAAGSDLRGVLQVVATRVYGDLPMDRAVNQLVGALEDVAARAQLVKKMEALGLSKELAALARGANIPFRNIDDLVRRFADEYITDQRAFSVASFELQAIMEIEEGILQANIAMFGLKQNGLFSKLADAAKASQSLMFLRLNPTYPIRNALNNELTMLIRGLWNAMGEEQIMGIWGKYGFDVLPSRLREGLGPAEVALVGVKREAMLAMGFEDAGEQAKKLIALVKAGNTGAIDRFTRTLRSSKLKDFGYMAALVERSASQRAYTAGFLHFMQKTWVPGVGYDTIERFAKYSGWTPGGLSGDVIKSIESQLRNATRPEQVDEILRGARVIDLHGAMDDVARRFGKSGDELRDILGQDYIARLQGIVDDSGGDIDKLTDGLRQIQNDLETHLRAQQVEHTKKILEEVEAAAKAGDASSLVQVMSDAQGELHALTMGYLSDQTDRVHQIRAIADAGERAAAWKQYTREGNLMFDGAIANLRARLEGSYRAAQHLGAPVDDAALRGMDDLRNALQRWNSEKAAAWNQFFRATKGGTVDSEEAMAKTVQQLDRSYQKFVNSALATQRQSDAAWLNLVNWGAPHMHAQATAGREVVLEMRKLYHSAVSDHFRKLGNVADPAERMALQDAFTKVRAQWMNRINVAEQETSLSVIRQTGWGTNLKGVDDDMLRIYSAKRHPPGKADTLSVMPANFSAHKKRFLETYPGHVGETPDEIMASTDWAKYVNQIETQASQGLGNLHGRMETRLSRLGAVDSQYLKANLALQQASLDGLSPAKAVEAAMKNVSGRSQRVRYLQHLNSEAMDPDVARAVRQNLTAEWRAASPEELGSTGKGLVQEGQYASLSAERSAMSAEENAAATERLEERLREMGFDPIRTKGGYTYEDAGAQGVSSEATFLVPGMDSRQAYMLGKEFGQEGVFASGKGTVNIQTGRLDEHDFAGVTWFDPKNPPEALPPGWTELEVGGQRMAFSAPMTGKRVPWVAELDGPNGEVSIFRLHNKHGFASMNPQNPAHWTGIGENTMPTTMRSVNEPRSIGYYIGGTPAESAVEGANSVRYATRVPVSKIYDIGEDPLNYAGRFIKPGYKVPSGSTKGLVVGPESEVLAQLRRDKYMGFRNTHSDDPNIVRIWDELEVEEVTDAGASLTLSTMKGQPMPAGAGPNWFRWARDNNYQGTRAWRYNPNARKGPTAIGTEIGKAMQEHFKISDKEARVLQVLTDGRARRWAQRTGGTIDDYYAQYLGFVDEGQGRGGYYWKIAHGVYNPKGAVIAGASYALEDGKAVISALQNPNFSTALHELVHAWRQDMSLDELTIIERAAGIQAPAYSKLILERKVWEAVPELKGHDDLIDILHTLRNGEIEWLGSRIDRTHTRSLAHQSSINAAQRSLADFADASPENQALVNQVVTMVKNGQIRGVHSTALEHLGRVDPSGNAVLRMATGELKLQVHYQSWWDASFIEERWIKNVMEYFQTGAVAGKGQVEMQGVFDSLKTWLGGVYKDGIAGSHPGLQAIPWNKELKDMMDEMFEGTMIHADEVPTPKVGIPVPEQKRMFGTNPSVGRALEELWWTDGRKMMGNLREELRLRARTPAAFKPELGNLTPEGQRFLKSYGEHVKGQLNDTVYNGMKWGEWRRDSTLLNYNRRSYFDQGLGYLMPFGFWTTHYMWNTMVHAFDRPQFMATMYRLNKYQSAVGQTMPQRFRNHLPIGKLPFAPEWMGNAYVNLLGSALPFNYWEQGGRDMEDSGRRVMSAAARVLQEQMTSGAITAQQYRDAINFRNTPEWNNALDIAKKNGNEPDPMEELQTFLSPHAPLLWAYHAARGTTDHIGPFLPLTRTIKGLSAMLGFGPPGGVNIEGWFRDKIGLPKFDRWDDYRVDRMLSNMVGDGTLTLEEAQRAMIERSGPNFELAQRRAGKEFGISAITGSMFPVRIYPKGEEAMLSLVAEMNEAYAKDKQLIPDGHASPMADKFWEEHPEVAARLAIFKSPEERMNQFLVDQVWQRWNSYNALDKDVLKAALGERFETQFLTRDTRDVESIPAEQLSIWLNMMGGDSPGTLGDGVQAVKTPPPELGERVEAYYNERRAQFGDMSPLWDEYFDLDKTARRRYWRAHPIMNAYVKWREQWLLKNPSVIPYLVENEEDRPLYKSVEARREALAEEPRFSPEEWGRMMTPSQERLVQDYVTLGEPLPEPMVQYLDDLAERLGTTRQKILAQMKGE